MAGTEGKGLSAAAPWLTLEDVLSARSTIASAVSVSPCARSAALSARTGADVFLKLENLQPTGSFKERGACNKLARLSAAERARGVITASAGNHAQGVAYHASRLGIDAVIVMPETTPLVKVQNTRALGAAVVLYGANYDEAADEASRLCAAEGRVFVHPFDDPLVMAGQGTLGLELVEQVPGLDAVIVAVGGGGLLAGVAVAVKGLRPQVAIYGVQTTVLASMKAALDAGGPVSLPAARTLADGIAVKRAGALTFEVARALCDGIVVVDDEEIAEAILVLLEREKTVAEGAGAAPLAALFHGGLPLAGKRVAVVICGGNIDVNVMARIIDRGLVKTGRLMRLRVYLPDVAGALAGLTARVADTRANIVQIHHYRSFRDIHLGESEVELVLETRGFEHVAEVHAALAAAGVRVDARDEPQPPRRTEH